MAQSLSSLTIFRRAFVDICRGYSSGMYLGKAIYVRHLSHNEHLDYDDLQASFEEEAKSKGATTEAERLAELRAQGLWSDAKEAEIEQQKETILRFEEGRKSIPVPSMLIQHDRHIAIEREKLTKMLIEKGDLMKMTVEVYAQQVLNDHYIITNLFFDRELTQQVFTPESFDDLNVAQVEEVHIAYNKAIEPCSDTNMRKLAVQDFFTSYYNLCDDNVKAFFGKPVCDLTYYQIRLANIARYFKSLIENTNFNNIDAKVKGDPDAIERMYTAQKNTATLTAEGKVPTNMSTQDIKDLGLQGQFTKLPNKELSGTELVKHLMAQRR